MYFIDCHCHFTNQRWGTSIGELIDQSRVKGIHYFMQGGIDFEDWQKQLSLKERFPGLIGLCFGLHPYRIIEINSEVELQKQLDLLAQNIAQADFLGELGLDYRTQWGGENPLYREWQMEVFTAQLELFEISRKPLVLHVVKAHNEVLRALDLFTSEAAQGASEIKGMVHGFNGSWELAQEYLSRGFMLSIGGAVTFLQNKKLHRTLCEMPLDRLLIESDAPDQPPLGWEGRENTPLSILEVAEKIGQLRCVSAFEIRDLVFQNFCRLAATSDLGLFQQPGNS